MLVRSGHAAIGLAMLSVAWCFPDAALGVEVSEEFTITFETGPLEGESFTGLITIDDMNFTRVGLEAFSPNGDFDGQLVSFDIAIGDVIFGIEDDVDFPGFPIVEFFEGELARIDFIGDTDGGDNGNFLEIFAFYDPGLVSFGPIDEESGVVSTGFVEGVATVPLPATALLLAPALAGLAVARRWVR